MATAEDLYKEALSLPLEARADLTERLVAALAKVHRRMAQIDSGEMTLIAGEEALARVRTRLTDHQANAE